MTTTTETENDYAVCLECEAEDVWFRSHNEGCTEAGDIVVKPAPEWGGSVADLMKDESN